MSGKSDNVCSCCDNSLIAANAASHHHFIVSWLTVESGLHFTGGCSAVVLTANYPPFIHHQNIKFSGKDSSVMAHQIENYLGTLH